MLTPAQLDRVGQGFRSGYRDGADGQPMRDLTAHKGTFYEADYLEGYKAGQNDARPRTKTVKLELSKPEAKALATLASEGAEGILTDASTTRGYLGGNSGADAARRALGKLDAAIADLERPGGCGAACIEAGTVSHGTLRSEDLIPAFAAELRRITSHPGNLTIADEADALTDFDSEEANELIDALVEVLDEHAPEGLYFGASEGDGADFGWWPVETFDVERPGGCGAARMVVQAITTRFLGPTNVRGSRIKAKSSAGSVTVGYDHALNVEDNHRAAALALVERLGWAVEGEEWHQGGLPDDRGYCFVCAK